MATVSGNSRQVDSSQNGTHPQLARQVLRHARHRWRKPPQAVDAAALAALEAALAQHAGPVILDSFCGTAMSTVRLATAHPDSLVVGVDQSAPRLQRHPPLPGNALLLRAHGEAVWRMLAARGTTLAAHYLLYPNPWPKPGHLGRRVHGHPAFPLLVALGGRLELRSNWQLYVEEFGVALHLLGCAARIATVPAEAEALTRFEQKYRQSGHTLWRLTADLSRGQMTLAGGAAPCTPEGDRLPCQEIGGHRT